MNHLHSNSPPIIYLDLTSNNVLIERLGDNKFICKIFGFTLAKMSDVSSITKQRIEGTTPSGTVAYIAPERYEASPYGIGDSEEKREVAKKSDVFSFGVLLWEIRERGLFKSLPEKAIYFRFKSGDGLPKGKHVGPRDYDQLVTDCTAFDPNQRPAFPDVIFILKRIIAEYLLTGGINLEQKKSNSSDLSGSADSLVQENDDKTAFLDNKWERDESGKEECCCKCRCAIL
eukprot:m.143128 g.143128  ORF g.143128 m.143128 type:complete len:230 (+) comp38378_c0_seq24:865-1554(+)